MARYCALPGYKDGGALKTIKSLLLPVLLLTLAFIDSGWACTSFVLKSGDLQVFGRNYDWGLSDGLLVVNKRDAVKGVL